MYGTRCMAASSKPPPLSIPTARWLQQTAPPQLKLTQPPARRRPRAWIIRPPELGMSQNRQLWRHAPVTTHPTPIIFLSPQMGLGRGARLCVRLPPPPFPCQPTPLPLPTHLVSRRFWRLWPPKISHQGRAMRGAVIVCGGAGRPGVFPTHHHRHQPLVALLETTEILINKQVAAYFCVNLGAFCGKL